MAVRVTVSVIDPISTNISSLFSSYRFVIMIIYIAIVYYLTDYYITVWGPGAPTLQLWEPGAPTQFY